MLTKRAQIPLKIGRIIELKNVECFQEEGILWNLEKKYNN